MYIATTVNRMEEQAGNADLVSTISSVHKLVTEDEITFVVQYLHHTRMIVPVTTMNFSFFFMGIAKQYRKFDICEYF